MPMHFGYQAHRHYGFGWRQPRSGRQMQQDPGYALRWHKLKMEAETNGELAHLIDIAQRAGWICHTIVDVFEADLDGDIAEIRRRKAALDRFRA
jgi:hypothetical protein